MNLPYELTGFLCSIREDSRISPAHISLFMAIIQYWADNHFQSPVCVFSEDLMRLAKISGSATYHKKIKDLYTFGYIGYEPSYNHFEGSLFYIERI